MLNQGITGGAQAADALVVGGGVIGLAIARSLARRAARRILLVERAQVGCEASHAAGGMLAAQAEADRADAFLELATASRDLYPEFAAALLEETGIDIELERTGTLYLALTDEDEREIEHRFRWQSRAGLTVERLTVDEARSFEPCINREARAALRFPLDSQVENRRLVAALSASVAKLGVRILSGTNVESLVVERGRVCGVETSRGRLTAPVVVVASGAWATHLMASEGHASMIKIEPVRGQMLCFEARPPLARHVIYSPRGYVVPRLDGRLLAGSTTEHVGFDKNVTAGGVYSILAHALEIAPALAELPLTDAWAGLRPRAVDDWPIVGASRTTAGLFYAVGHYRNGILLAPITGRLVADEIMGNVRSPLLKAFTPERFSSSSVC